MRKSGYRTIVHIYLIFFLVLGAAVASAAGLFLMLTTVRKTDGPTVRSDWPKTVTEDFRKQIFFVDGGVSDAVPQVKQAGIALLQDNHIGLQIIDPTGREVYSYQRPEQAGEAYSGTELLQLGQTGRTSAFTGTVSDNGKEYVYILHFPMEISKVTMYLNGEKFTGGKAVILPVLGILLAVVIFSGARSGWLTTRAIKGLTASVQDIAARRYLPVEGRGTFQDLYDSLNTLDGEIRASDQLRRETEIMQEEWISNITHDLKTPLSPIKGYAEILESSGAESPEQCRRYAGIMLNNAAYMETLIEDLKLTYQLKNGMVPVKYQETDIGRFLKELAIDILNTPEYENRAIHFESSAEAVLYSFYRTLMTRALRNLIINAFIHGNADTEVTLELTSRDNGLQILVSDNGTGMKPEYIGHLFDRYYRGTGTRQKTEGTGLGLAIARSIIELHGGRISVSSIPDVGTAFKIEFPLFKVN